MHAVVSMLDPDHYDRVESLWVELERRFGVKGIYGMPFPYFAYLDEEIYDYHLAQQVLAQLTRLVRPFLVQAQGLGVFTGASPVLYIPIARTLELQDFRNMLQHKLSVSVRKARNLPDHTGPFVHTTGDHWLPHITLAQKDIDREMLSEVIRYLSERDFSWQIEVNNLAIVESDGAKQSVVYQVGFANSVAAC